MKAEPRFKIKPTPGGWYYHPYEISLSGYSGSGKTTLARQLIAALAERRLTCGFIKHDAHRFEMDKPGKDTHQASQAGARGVYIQDPRHAALILDHGPQGPSQGLAEQALAPLDCLIIEGNKHSDLPKLILLDPRGEIDQEILQGDFTAPLALIHARGDEARALALADSDFNAETGAPPSPGIPVFCRDDIQGITTCILEYWAGRVPPVHALILGGGQSSRMGQDKSLLSYHGTTSQLAHTADMAARALEEMFPSRQAAPGPESPIPDAGPLLDRASDRSETESLDRAEIASSDRAGRRSPRRATPGPESAEGLPRVYLSLRPGQEVPQDARDLPVIRDCFPGRGPVAGILSALEHQPGSAWLVLSCDLPLLDPRDLARLLKSRNPFALATSLKGFQDQPEPLCAIYEPKARPRLLSFIAQGSWCPRWALRSGGTTLITPENPQSVFNANTPEDRRRAAELLQLSESGDTP